MAGGDTSSPQPPPAKRPKESSQTTIHSLGEDLLLVIFLRLPSLATLVRAALTCRSWRRAVATSPSFRRRFRALHPPPLLGFFFEAPGPAQYPNVPAFPSFAPARPCDRDLAAAIGGGDFFFTALQCRADESPCWDVFDCCCGYALLMNWDDGLLLLMNPLTRRSEDAFDLGSKYTFEGSSGQVIVLNARLLYSDEDPSSYRVVVLAHDESRIRANVFSSDSKEWSVLPWVDVPAAEMSDDSGRWVRNEGGMQGNGSLYWAYEDRKYLISLNTVTMEFSVAEMPRCLRNATFDVGMTKDGAACIVYSDEFKIGILMHTRDADGTERWVLDREVSLDSDLRKVIRGDLDDNSFLIDLVDDPSELIVLAVRDGYAYLVAHRDPQTPCWFLSLCIETLKLERLFRRTFDDVVYPYVMGWPSSLVGNHGKFALEDAA